MTGTVFSDPIDLGTKKANDDGKVSFTFSVRDLAPGEHKVVLSSDNGSASARFRVSDGGEFSTIANSTTTNSGSPEGNNRGNSADSDDLAYTGSNAIVPLSIVGGMLLLGGAAAVVSSRRKTKTHV